MAYDCDPTFLKIFPRATKEQDEMFKLLKKAYIVAQRIAHKGSRTAFYSPLLQYLRIAGVIVRIN